MNKRKENRKCFFYPPLCSRRCSRRNQSGATIVEFAIILPLFLILIFGIIEFSILMYDRAMLINASREGARTGVVYGSTTEIIIDEDGDEDYEFSYLTKSDIENVVLNYCSENLISFKQGAVVLVETNPQHPENANSGDYLTVTVEYDFDFLVFSKFIFENGIPLKAVTIMRFE